MKEKNILKIINIIFLFLSFFFNAQNHLWTIKDIRQNEEELIRSLKKYEKKQSKDQLKNEFLMLFRERQAFHESVVDGIIKESDDKKDWVNWINRITSLRYIYDLSASALAKNNIPHKNFNTVLDRVTSQAVTHLYARGVKAVNDTSASNHLSVAYRTLSVVQQLHPGYKDTEELLAGLKLYANKTAYLEPLEMGNKGNFFHVKIGSSSSFDDHIRNKIEEEVNPKAIGFKIENASTLKNDYDISIDWTRIDYNNGHHFKNTYERTATVRNNTVKATAVYETQRINLTSSFEVVIRDKLSGRTINSQIFNNTESIDYITASYTGDREALTHADNEVINNSRFNTIDQFKGDYLYNFYDQHLNPKIAEFITGTLGW